MVYSGEDESGWAFSNREAAAGARHAGRGWLFPRQGADKQFPRDKTYRLDERAEIYTRYGLLWTRVDSTDEELEIEKEIGLRHYLRGDRIEDPCRGAPRLIIAIRGTKENRFQDARDDKRIASHTLHHSPRFQKCQELVKKMIQKFEQNCDGRRSDVFIAGDSLGAAIALAIGTDHAALNQRYAVHGFNPTLVTDNSFPNGIVRQVLNVANESMLATVKQVRVISESKLLYQRCRRTISITLQVFQIGSDLLLLSAVEMQRKHITRATFTCPRNDLPFTIWIQDLEVASWASIFSRWRSTEEQYLSLFRCFKLDLTCSFYLQ